MGKNRLATLAAMGGLLLGGACTPTRSPAHTAPADTLVSDSVRAARALQKSLSLFEVGDTTAAIDSLRIVLSLTPQNPYLYELMGFYHYTQAQDDSALYYYRKALEHGGASAELHHRIASAFLLKKDFAQAQYHLQKALALDSLNPNYWITYGLWAHQQGKYPLAETYWKKALALDSTADKARAFLFDLYLATYHKPEEAKKRFLDPYWQFNRFHPFLNYQLGLYFLYHLQREPNPRRQATLAFSAIQAFTQAILAHPTYADAYYGRGYVLFLAKKYDRALEDFARAYELNPKNPKITFMLASLYEYKGDTTKAISFYEKTFLLDSTFTEAQKALRELKAKS
jgi:tetratricopeptide (TPR) repeat protein